MDNNFREILNKQKQANDLLELEIKNLENLDMTKRNQTLEKEAVKLQQEMQQLNSRLTELNSINSELRNTIYSKLYGERLSFIDKSEKKMEAYFAYGRAGEFNRLVDYENRFKALIDARLAELRANSIGLGDELNAKITASFYDLRQEINARLAQEKKNIAPIAQPIAQEMQAGYEAFRQEEITQREIQNIAKQSNWERFLGLNVINKIGIGLIVIAVILASQYAYQFIGDGVKALLIFVLGGILITVGEIIGGGLRKKEKKNANVFSIGLISGGVAVLYVALFASYFTFNVFGIPIAAIICILITAGAFFQSIRHNSQVIATFSLIGGFLPIIIADRLDETMTYAAMAYFIVLGGFALSLSFKKKWIVTAFFGLSLNIITTIIISTFFDWSSSTGDKIILLSYAAVSFIIYTLIPIIGTYTEGLTFKQSDIVLTAINTVASTIILYVNFYNLEIVEFNGLIPFVFMLLYIGLGLLLRWKMRPERNMRTLFSITAVTFFILVIPMHFDTMWWSLGWLIQGTALAATGIITNKQKFTIPGLVIGALCLCSFMFLDVTGLSGEYFEWKYFAITLAALIITAMYAIKQQDNAGIKAFKYVSCVNLWLFLIYIIYRGCEEFLEHTAPWYGLICIVVTFILAFAYPRIKPIKDGGMTVVSHVLCYIGMFWLFIGNFMGIDTAQYAEHTDMWFLAAVMFAVVNLVSIATFGSTMHLYFKKTAMRIEWLPFLLSCWFMLVLTQNLIVIYNASFSGMTISVVYAILALAWCVFGFMKRFTFMRRLGLGLALLVTSKLFIIDLWTLTEGYRIITFFALGVALLGISFVYQQFTKRIDSTGIESEKET
ncbi:MAG: DUF2339 domain-containing protein [Oscillospiraceae bacterium]|nr:DUF2339 domain-containing protein [Oscillospiraceae bacterium]